MDSMFEIMQALRAGRAMVGLSQEELAERAGVSRTVIARLERGEENISAEYIEKVRAALQTEGVDFFPSTSEHGPGLAASRRRPATD